MSGPFPYFNVPKTGQTLGNTRTKINSNFDTIFQAFKQNHYKFDVANAGKHSFIQIQATSLPAGLSNGDGNIYCKTVSGRSQIFYSPDNTSLEFQLTTGVTGQNDRFGTNNVAGATGGWSFLPGGLLMNYGAITLSGNTTSVSFPKFFTGVPFSVTISQQITSATANNEVYIGTATPTNSGFDIRKSSAAVGNLIVNFIAIGKA